MANIRTSPYNNPDIGALFGNVASALAPPSGSDLAGYATAGLNNEKKRQISALFDMSQNPNVNLKAFDLGNIVAGNLTGLNTIEAQNQNNDTARYKIDQDNKTDAITKLFGGLGQGEIRPALPGNVAGEIGLPALPQTAGAPKPLSESEVQGAILQGMTPDTLPTLTNDQLVGIATKGVGTQNIVDPKTGKPVVALDAQAVGQEPAYAPKADGQTITTNPDGTVTVTTGKAPTEGQSKDMNYLARGTGAEATLDKLGSVLGDVFKGAATGNTAIVGNFLKTPEYRQAEQAGREFLAALLRKDSGAQITTQEMQLYGPMYLPVPGDDPGTIEQKRASRARALAGIEAGLPGEQIAKLERAGLLQPGGNNPTAPAPVGDNAAPEGTVVTDGNGRQLVKRNGKWEPTT